MKVLIDTSIWSLVFRRKSGDLNPDQLQLKAELESLIEQGCACLIGIIRQEILSGIRDPNAFHKLKTRLREFPDESIDTEVYEQAALFSNTCRSAGISGTPVDYLICAVAHGHGMSIFTTDKDFLNYARCLPINLHNPGLMPQYH